LQKGSTISAPIYICQHFSVYPIVGLLYSFYILQFLQNQK